MLTRKDLFGNEIQDKEINQANENSLFDKFGMVPFSVFDTRMGYWQKRKNELKGDLFGELGREARALNTKEWVVEKTNKFNTSSLCSNKSGVSIFDPVLTEIIYKWFCPKDGRIIDPFAGGDVRGKLATKFGFDYTGIELRGEQVKINQLSCNKTNWIVGDSENVSELTEGQFDLLFTCPPYYDLEVYSDLNGELSALKTYSEFIDKLERILTNCLDLLSDNSFSCIVVGDIRDKKGFYRNFVSDVKQIFIDNGHKLYNEIILIEQSGSACIRAEKQMMNRKVVKTHQHILVFYNGDTKKIKNKFGTEVYRK